MQANHYTTEEELSKELRVSQRHLINMRNRRLLPHLKLGRRVIYDKLAVQKALEKLTIKEIN